MRQPWQDGEVIDLATSDTGAQVTILAVPQGKRFAIEWIGVNTFTQLGQKLFAALHVTTAGYLGLYSIVLAGGSTVAEPTFPARAFAASRYGSPPSQR